MIVHAIFGNIPLPKRTSSHKPPAEVSPPKFYLAPAPLHSFNTIIACWFVGGDDLNKALHVLWLQLSPPPRSSLAPVISRMELFWYRLPQIHLKMAVKPERGGMNRQINDRAVIVSLGCVYTRGKFTFEIATFESNFAVCRPTHL